MEQTKKKIEDAFNIIEHRLIDSGKLTATDRKKELQQIDIAIGQLESELDRFQMIAFVKYSNEIDDFEERLRTIKIKLKKMNEEGITASQIVEEVKEEEVYDTGIEDAAQKQIEETNEKLKDGKERAIGMLKTVNNMKEELNLIDDEIMLQREKMIAINDKMKQTQSVVFQTRKLVGKLAKSLSDDLFMKIMIGVIVLAILVVVGLIVSIKFKQKTIEKTDELEKNKIFKEADFEEIDEELFYKLETDPENELKKLADKEFKRKKEKQENKKKNSPDEDKGSQPEAEDDQSEPKTSEVVEKQVNQSIEDIDPEVPIEGNSEADKINPIANVPVEESIDNSQNPIKKDSSESKELNSGKVDESEKNAKTDEPVIQSDKESNVESKAIDSGNKVIEPEKVETDVKTENQKTEQLKPKTESIDENTKDVSSNEKLIETESPEQSELKKLLQIKKNVFLTARRLNQGVKVKQTYI